MLWLVADVGGTWTRCAIGQGLALRGEPVVYRNADFGGLGTLLERFLAGQPGGARPRAAAIGVAGPVSGDTVRMLNNGWEFSQAGLAAELGLERLIAVNDFEAIAWSLPVLGANDVAAVGTGTAVAGGPCIAIGPGTGLGVAALVQAGRVVVAGEGGHVSLAAQDDVEERIIRRAREHYGHCSAERILSGNGLSFLYQTLHGGPLLETEDIGRRLAAREAAALAAFEQFCRFLGGVAGDVALTFCATGGVWLGGGILPRYVEDLRQSGFRERFESKGRYRKYLAAIPVRVITTPYPALRGLLAMVETPDAMTVADRRS